MTNGGVIVGAFDSLWSKEKLIKKTIEIDNTLYEKMKNISNTYISSTDAEGNTTTKKIKMKQIIQKQEII